MKATFYAIKDELSEFSPAVVPFEEEGQAKRWFRDYVKGNSIMSANPEDFSIWKVGTIDTKTGIITGLIQPELTERAKGVKIEHEE